MRHMLIVSLLAIALCTSGCGAVEFGLSDVSGWDLSACGEDFDSFSVCSDLFFDNEELILGGETLIDVLLGQVSP